MVLKVHRLEDVDLHTVDDLVYDWQSCTTDVSCRSFQPRPHGHSGQLAQHAHGEFRGRPGMLQIMRLPAFSELITHTHADVIETQLVGPVQERRTERIIVGIVDAAVHARIWRKVMRISPIKRQRVANLISEA
jgi:hypothetical protein